MAASLTTTDAFCRRFIRPWRGAFIWILGTARVVFSFNTAEHALEQDVLPGTISSDVHQWNVNGPVFDLATTLSKFMQLGLTLEQVIERATKNPSMIHGQLNGLGTLKVGAEADVAVFDLDEGDFVFTDALGATRIGHQLLRPRGHG